MNINLRTKTSSLLIVTSLMVTSHGYSSTGSDRSSIKTSSGIHITNNLIVQGSDQLTFTTKSQPNV
jgi:hypothetical protein